MTIGERIAARRQQLGLTQEELAHRMGYKSKSSINKIELQWVNVPLSKLEKVAEALSCDPGYLMGWTEPEITDNTVNFQVIGDIAAGYCGEAVEEFTGEEVKIPIEWLRGRKTTDYFVLRVKGDSMFPEYQEGDYILVKRQTTLDRSGQIGVVMYEDTSATLKKVEFVYGEDWMKLVPINPNYPPVMVKNEALEHCRVLGYPVKLIRDIT